SILSMFVGRVMQAREARLGLQHLSPNRWGALRRALLSAGPCGVAMQGAVFFRLHHGLAIRSEIQALPVKIVPLPLRLAHLWSIQALTWQFLGPAADDGIGVLRLAG